MAEFPRSVYGEPRNDSIDSFVIEAAAIDDPLVSNPRGLLTPGRILSDRFIIRALARRGGMGAVYRADDLYRGEPVAIKVMDRLGGGSRGRFEREALVLAQLSHPAIVRYLGHGTTDEGPPYLAMEWLEGEDLSQRLSRFPLGVEESLLLIQRVCEGLASAHAHGIVHRDIKPSNLFLLEGNPATVKVLDFGIARLGGEARALTGNGTILGTVGYMAPEQAMGANQVDARADVFAIGCVLYECLTGRAPFESPHAVAVLAKVLREDPAPPSELRSAVHPQIDALVARLLAKNPEQRPADAATVLEELEALANPESSPPLPPPRSRRALPHAEQRIVSVILGKPEIDEVRTDATWTPGQLQEHSTGLRELSDKFSAELSPLRGGALILVLTEKGEANDRAAQAAQCALALRQLLPGLQLAVATGLAQTSGHMPVGAAIDRAAALLSEVEAPRPGIVIDELTVGLIAFRFVIRLLGQRHVLVSERRDYFAPRLLMGKPTPCVGRDRELRLLEGILEECVADQLSRAVFVTGPPGIGKSRLASEWLARSRPTTAIRMLIARSEPMTSGSALFLVQQLVRYAAGLRDSESPESQHALLRSYLESIVATESLEQLCEFLGEVIGAPTQQPPSPILQAARRDPEIMREQVRRTLEAWIEAELQRQPLVLLLEDLHWGDTQSVLFLVDSLRRLANRPLLVVALARPEAEQRFPALCQQAAVHVRLCGLTPRAAEQLVSSALPAPDPDIVAGMIRVADGNAFYLEELIRRVAAGSVEWPDTVLAMAQSRLEQLKGEERYVLRVASVFGESCWDAGVAELVLSNTDTSAQLEALANRELLLRVADSRYAAAREYRFRHALLRDAAYAMLTDEDRAIAHRAVGDWLERAGEKDARLLADHYAAGNAPERAIPLIVRAARAAVDGGDIQTSIALSERGLRLGAEGADRGLLLLSRGYAEIWSGRIDLEVLREALALLPAGSGPWWLTLASSVWGATASGKLADISGFLALTREPPQSAEELGPYGQSLFALVGALVLLGKNQRAAELLEQAARAGAKAGANPVFEALLNASHAALAAVAPIDGSWHLELAFQRGRESTAQLATIGASFAECDALNYFAVAAMHVGRYAEARAACQRSIATSERNGNVLSQTWARLFMAKADIRLGDTGSALATLTELRTSRDQNVLQMVPIITAEARYWRSQFAEAIREGEQAIAGASPRLRRLAGSPLARAQLALGQTGKALATVARALAEATDGGFESDIDLQTIRAEALLAQGDVDAARVAIRSTRDRVVTFATAIEDPALRASFLENIEPCARALQLAARLLQDEGN